MENPITNNLPDDFINEALIKLAQDDPKCLDAYLSEVETNTIIDQTKITSHCYCLKSDGNGRPRVNALIKQLCEHIIPYAIPRSKVKEALEKSYKTGNPKYINRYSREAIGLFTHLANTGECGELLLYMLAENYLKLPLLMTKMDLKTDPNVHFHGVDGVYAGVDKDTNNLCLYWGESKMYQKRSDAVNDCLESLSSYMKDEGHQRETARDFQLLQRQIDLSDESLEKAIKHYLDPESAKFNELTIKGIALVCFKDGCYPDTDNNIHKTLEETQLEIKSKLPNWKQHLKKRAGIEKIISFDFHFFFIPIPCAETFRKSFLEILNHGN